uniref:Ribosomal protein L5 n=1 Tax=Vischeria stellata TaxID=1104407 RepID=A0A481XI54_9STRA|nr:ribosomal protein L5 [Vischeria stellata]QBK36857.1 ribosomal protein L5 [Vischeria stellata]
MFNYKYNYDKIIKQNLLTKFTYINPFEIPSVNKVVLRFNISQDSLKILLPTASAIFVLATQKPSLNLHKKIQITLSIKSGIFLSCKLSLRKDKKDIFLENLVFFIFPKVKNVHYFFYNKMLQFNIKNVFLYKELENDYDYFQDLPKLNVSMYFNNIKNFTEVSIFLICLNFPFTKYINKKSLSN